MKHSFKSSVDQNSYSMCTGDTCVMLSTQPLKRVRLLLASYRTDSVPCGQGTCAPTTAHACTSPQPTVVPDGPGHRRAATSLLVERRMPRRSVPSVKRDIWWRDGTQKTTKQVCCWVCFMITWSHGRNEPQALMPASKMCFGDTLRWLQELPPEQQTIPVLFTDPIF